jgi:predicted restriction endonuclease
VLERDGCRCTVPGCRNKRYIALHHIDPLQKGGLDKASNLTTVCGNCHRALHRKKLFVEGKAPGALIWRDKKGQLLNRFG